MFVWQYSRLREIYNNSSASNDHNVKLLTFLLFCCPPDLQHSKVAEDREGTSTQTGEDFFFHLGMASANWPFSSPTFFGFVDVYVSENECFPTPESFAQLSESSTLDSTSS